MIATKKIEICGEQLTLTNYRAGYWERQKMLFLSDLHIGKTAHFRRNGISVPASVLQEDLHRIDQLLVKLETQRLVIVGDMFHAGENKDMEVFTHWREQHAHLRIELIKGNHDRISENITDRLGIELFTQSREIGPFSFVHDIKTFVSSCFTISGHVHPGVSVPLGSYQQIKLPCFAVYTNYMVLPAFSLFTGYNILGKNDGAKNMYALTQQAIIRI